MNKDYNHFYNATNNLIEQQFYLPGTDQIIGRTPEISIKISFSGQVVRKFKDLFNENLSYFLQGKYLKFLKPFEKIKGMDQEIIEKIHDKLQKKLDLIEDSPQFDDPIIVYTIVLSTIITRIRDMHFNDSLNEIRERIKVNGKFKEKRLNENVVKNLEHLFMTNNENISILYNISYLDALAESFNYTKVARICKIQKSKYINRILDLILD
jgi:hypothetical protein